MLGPCLYGAKSLYHLTGPGRLRSNSERQISKGLNGQASNIKCKRYLCTSSLNSSSMMIFEQGPEMLLESCKYNMLMIILMKQSIW